MKNTTPQHNEGMALLLALFFIAIAIVAVSTLSSRLINQRLAVDAYETYQSTFQGLEAAVAQSRMQLETGQNGIIGLDNLVPSYDANNAFIWPEMSEATPEILESAPDILYATYAVDWGNDGRDSNGDGVVDSNAEEGMYTVYAMAQEGQFTRRAEVVYQSQDVNVWRNAIFAGAGQAGAVINGNVSIHGSVHLLGNNLSTGGAAITAMDLSGTSLVHNNYQGVPSDLVNRVPPLPLTVFNGETISTLNANLRVKQGRVSMSGNSEIGEPNVSGNNRKETMDGTYVSDGWAGNSVTNDGGRGIPSKVFSDNGWNEVYDLGDRVTMPLLSDEWRWPDTGAFEHNPDTNDWYTHEDFFNQVLLADPDDPNDGRFTGNLVFNARGSHVYWNATQNIYLVGSLPTTAPAPDDDYLMFNVNTNVLQMNGQITIDGNLSFIGQGNQRTINYSGRAAILVNGDVEIATNLLSCNNGNPNNTANSFPVNNIIGIMASNNMLVGTTAQCNIMGAFYAQNRITAQRQTNVMGTFVSNYFDMGGQVPSIFQVPTLADNLPLGMIGNYPLLVLSQRSWREIGVD